MNKEEILAMEAGEELDWEVAKLMNVEKSLFNFAYEAGNYNYSTDISAAWEVVEKMRERFDWVGIDTCQKTKYRCLIIDRIILDGDEVSGECFADTAPLAICKAALLALIDS